MTVLRSTWVVQNILQNFLHFGQNQQQRALYDAVHSEHQAVNEFLVADKESVTNIQKQL
jgi:hypothetical protein